MQRGSVATVWRDTPAAIRSALMVVLGGVALVGALLPWLTLVSAWTQTSAAVGPEVSRLLVVRDALVYGLLTYGQPVTPYAVAAAVALVVLSGAGAVSDVGSREKRAADGEAAAVEPGRPRLGELGVPTAVAVLAAMLGLVVAVVPFVLDVYATTASAQDSSQGLIFYPDAMTLTARLLASVVVAAAWSVVLLLAFARWRGVPRGPDADSDGRAAGTGEGARPDRAAAADSPTDPPVSAHGTVAGTTRPTEPARLRPDGSSDSGFDEFHFRR